MSQIENHEQNDDTNELSITQELKKRRREVLIIFFISFFFVSLTWFEIRLFSTSQQLPFVHSIFFFGLVNFNIILLLLLFFLIFRNVVKVFVERRGKIFGSSLKAKLIAAFVAFSFIPTLLMFFVSVFYINSSFDKWFSVKMASVLKSSLEVTNAYYFDAKKKNYHFAHEIAKNIRKIPQNKIQSQLENLRSQFALDSVEYYPTLFGRRTLVTDSNSNLPSIPNVALDFLEKGIANHNEASTIHQFGDGNLVRVIVPISDSQALGAIVVSSFVPMSLISKMNDVTSAYDEFRDINPLEYPLKSIYLIILFLLTMVILLAATWFGFHLAKQLSIPLVLLGRATRRVSGGDYSRLDIRTGSEEIAALVDSFNQMTTTLESSLTDLDRHSRYIEVVLKNVSAGIISIDNLSRVTTINRRAAELLKIQAEKYIHQPMTELSQVEHLKLFFDLLQKMQEQKVESIQTEFRLNVQGEAVPLQVHLAILKNEQGEEIGKILVFDDMSPIVNAQRSAAWTEVARRIAHEIKNPLTPIKLSAERLQRKFGAQISDPAFSECTTMIIKQTDGLKTLVNEFSQFARLPQTKLVIGSIEQVINESIELFKQAHPQVEFKIHFDQNLPDFKFDHDQIKRVLVNLIDNSISAVAKVQQPTVEITTRYDNAIQTMRLTVADNGQGIPVQERGRIFEPYYSTKEGGTGLGLAIVKRIVEDHNGFIRAQANDKQGTKMLIEIPVNKSGE